MLKILLSIALAGSVLFANETQNSEETYTFTAKGEFAKELKALMEKYEKDGKVEINEIKVDESAGEDGFIDGLLSGKARAADLTLGKKVYDSQCVKCHGASAEKSTYASARNLRTLSKDEIEEQLENYRRDSTYGNGAGIIMHKYAAVLNTKEIRSLAEYISSFDMKTSGANAQPSGVKQKSKTQGSYLK